MRALCFQVATDREFPVTAEAQEPRIRMTLGQFGERQTSEVTSQMPISGSK